MTRSTILLLGLAAWVLAACGSSTSMEEAHEDEHEHMEDEHDDDHDHDHHHDEEEEMITELGDWLEMRAAFNTMPQAPANMMVSTGTPGPATWEGDIYGTINPSYPTYTDPEIRLELDEHATMHGDVFVHTPDSDERKFVHHLDAEGAVTGSTFASHEDDDNRMTGTFYGPDHGTVVGTVNTAIVIGTYRAEHADHAHDH